MFNDYPPQGALSWPTLYESQGRALAQSQGMISPREQQARHATIWRNHGGGTTEPTFKEELQREINDWLSDIK